MSIISANMKVMIRAAEKAGRSLVRDFGEVEQLQVSRKGPGDFVSAADRRAEEIIYNELSKSRPDYSFLMEESGSKTGSKEEGNNVWIIDPLDGTTNFLHGIPHWAISIGLESDGEIIAGLIFDPVKDEMYRAEKGGGAFVNNRRMRVSGRNHASDCLIANGDGGTNHKRFLNSLSDVTSSFPFFRRMGAASLDMAYVASGRMDAFWEVGIKPWDVAAGVILVKEAGGMVTEINGGKNVVHGGNILASNGNFHQDILNIFK